MLTPSNRTITIASGGTALVGRTTAIPAPGGGGSSNPAWLQAHDAAVGLNAWRAIPNTSGAGGASVNVFSGFAEKNGMLISAAAGGHSDSSDNRVTTCDFLQDAPTWIIRSPGGDPTPFGQVTPDAAYNADGKPNSGHNRCELWWSAKYNRVVRIGARDLYTQLSVGSKAAVSSFNLDTNQWDAAGYFPDITDIGGTPGSAYVIGGAFIDVDDSFNIYSGQRKMSGATPGTAVWTGLLSGVSPGIRAPWAVAPELNLVFGFAIGGGWGGETGYRAIKIQNGVQTAITINPSAALTDFESKTQSECGMHYDPLNNRFVFSNGSGLWAIVPNGTNTWDMVAFTYGSGSATLPATVAAIENRFMYSRALKGFLIMPDANSNVYFMRTST
jgi:hypothetical protein